MKKLLIMAAAAVMATFLGACGGGGGGTNYTPPPIVAAAEPGWKQSKIKGLQTDYVATIRLPFGQVKFFQNPGGDGKLSATSATLFVSDGPFQSAIGPKIVINYGNRMLRTVAMGMDDSGVCYGMFGMTGLGKGYGEDSYYPTAVQSGPDCQSIEIVKERVDFINTNSMAFTVINGPLNAPINDVNPRANKFTFLTDGISGVRSGLMYSSDHRNYKTWKDSTGKAIEMLPVELAGLNLVFASEVKAKFNYYLALVKWNNGNNTSEGIVFLSSCDGLKYRVLELSSPIATGEKGVSLSFDSTTNEVTALVPKNGDVFSFVDKVRPCAQ